MPVDSNLDRLFEHAGCVAMNPPILQPADPFLNAAGEAFRKTLFITARADGETLCLRPEFTIPVCAHHLKTGETTARYHYRGTVFRQRLDGNSHRRQEFDQAGVEALGDKDFAKADAEMVQLALEAVRYFPNIEPEVVLGNPSFFNALVDPLGLPDTWRQRLIRAFGDADLLARLLQKMVDEPDAAPAELASESLGNLEGHVAELMIAHGLTGTGGRTPLAIAKRYRKKRQDAVRIDTAIAEICQLFLALECRLSDAPEMLARFAKQNGADFKVPLRELQAQIDNGMVVPDVPMRFAASFGRRLDYYTGFVFEIYDANNRERGPVAGGGRYDRLTEMLGHKSVPAVGFSLWLDRLKKGAGQ